MENFSDGSFICPECGKVCKSCGGLTEHSAVHKRNIRVGEPHENFHRIYHPVFDGTFDIPFTASASD